MLAYSSRKRLRVSSKNGRSRGKSPLKITLLTEGFEWWEIRTIRSTEAQPRPAPGMRQDQLRGMVILVRTSRARRRNGSHRQSWIELTKCVVCAPACGHLTWRIVMHQQIRPTHEPMQLLLLVAQVERHSSLVSIQI